MISVLIPARNEADNIIACLDSVRWADEVFVLDSDSRDGTVELAQKAGATVVQFRWNRQLPKKKNWGLEHIPWKNDWVLILDADERITPELASEIQSEVRCPQADGYFINRRFIFLDKWIRHCGYYPSWNLRLFRHTKGRYEKLHVGDTASGDNEVHEHVVLNGATAYLKADMLHFAYPNIHTWMEKHNRYSNWEAEVEFRGIEAGLPGPGVGEVLSARRKLRTFSRHLPFRPALRFIYSYILKRGFLDGYEGYVFCRLLAMYEALSVFKAYELRRGAMTQTIRSCGLEPETVSEWQAKEKKGAS
jgi:glycosyltransferase involved in cell wall biosynthesis